MQKEVITQPGKDLCHEFHEFARSEFVEFVADFPA
jgi:hypothetical protein